MSMRWIFYIFDMPKAPKLLDFKRKPWEKLKIKTETKNCWNFGFIDGFDHVVYTLIVLSVVYHFYGFYGFRIAAIVMPLLFFSMEFIQAYYMRDRQLKRWWEFWRWHNGRQQDYLLPLFAVVFFYLLIR